MRAGYCAECEANVWLDASGACTSGHAASSVSGTYDVESPVPPLTPSVRREIPRWLSAPWGIVLLMLTIFTLLYVVGFAVTSVPVAGRFGGPEWLQDIFFGNGVGAAPILPIVGVALALSFAFMGLSIAHAFVWSGLTLDRKLVWSAVVFAGAQPGMLIYWYANVWRRGLSYEPKPEAAETPARRAGQVLLGLLTVLPSLYFVLFFLLIGFAMTGSTSDDLFALLPVTHLGMIFLWWGLTAYYLVHVFRTPRLVGTNKALWAALIAFGGPIAWPVYWYMHVWRKPSASAIAPA